MSLISVLAGKSIESLGYLMKLMRSLQNSARVLIAAHNNKIYAVKIEGMVASEDVVTDDTLSKNQPDIPRVFWGKGFSEKNGPFFGAWMLFGTPEATRVGQLLGKSICAFNNIGKMSTKDIRFSNSDRGEYDVFNQIKFDNGRTIVNKDGEIREKLG